jgi:FMN phosphatase YigB (HAD superfamily)
MHDELGRDDVRVRHTGAARTWTVPARVTQSRSTYTGRRGWQLVILSHRDRDLIDASIGAIGVSFSAVIVAFKVGSYTPALGQWRAFYGTTRADREHHVYFAQSRFHDIVAAYELGVGSVWINQLGERAQPTPTRELPDLHGLADVLDELVP